MNLSYILIVNRKNTHNLLVFKIYVVLLGVFKNKT